MRDSQTVVHHDAETGTASPLGCLFVLDTELQPERPSTDARSLVGNLRRVLRTAKHVDDVDLFGNLEQRRIRFLSENLGLVRVDWNHAVARAEELHHDAVRRPLRLG